MAKVLGFSTYKFSRKKTNNTFTDKEIVQLADHYGVNTTAIRYALRDDKRKPTLKIKGKIVYNRTIAEIIDCTITGARLKRRDKTFSGEDLKKLSEHFKIKIEPLMKLLYAK